MLHQDFASEEEFFDSKEFEDGQKVSPTSEHSNEYSNSVNGNITVVAKPAIISGRSLNEEGVIANTEVRESTVENLTESPNIANSFTADNKSASIKPPSRAKGKYFILFTLLFVISTLVGTILGVFISEKINGKENKLFNLPQHLLYKKDMIEQKNHLNSESKKEVNSQVTEEGRHDGKLDGESEEGYLLTPKDISRLASPAVVAIHTQTRVVNFFGQVGKQEGAGSGVVIRQDGYIVTNNHVVEGANELFVRFSDGTEMPAKLIGRDAETDLAVIKVESDKLLPYLGLADSSHASVGDQVVAIGNPLGEFAGSLTVGYISALDRSLTVRNQDNTATTLVGLIQTDAAINRGNSGGALINLRGELLGINTVKTAAVGVEGLGFAIPANTVRPIVEDLIEFGKIKARPVIGISGQAISEDMRQIYGLPEGIWVREVYENTPASKAGIKAQDIIVAFNGKEIKSVQDLNAYKNTFKDGDKIVLTVLRQGERVDIELTLALPEGDGKSIFERKEKKTR